jgi:hypothetical protein
MIAGRVSSLTPAKEPTYDILIEDADGRHVWLESTHDLKVARRRLPALAAEYRGIRLILWNHKTRTILAQTDGY